MDKEIKITISDREAYYLCLAVGWKKGQRRNFGVSGLGDKVYDQLLKETNAQRLAELNGEWESAKEEAERTTRIPSKQEEQSYCTTHRIIGKCVLCKKRPAPVNLKRITTPEMERIRFQEVAGGRADKDLKKLETKLSKIATEKRLGS